MDFAAALAAGFGNQSCPCALLNACLVYEPVKITDFLCQSIKITFFYNPAYRIFCTEN